MSEREPFLPPEQRLPPTLRYYRGSPQEIIYGDAVASSVVFGDLHTDQKPRFSCGIGLVQDVDVQLVEFFCVERLNLLVPILAPHVLAQQTELADGVVRDAVLGVNDWMHGRFSPNRHDASRAYASAHVLTPKILPHIDPEIVDDLALVLFAKGATLDWVATYHRKNEAELGRTPFLDVLAKTQP